MNIINLCTCLRDTDLQSDLSLALLNEKHTELSANPVKILSKLQYYRLGIALSDNHVDQV